MSGRVIFVFSGEPYDVYIGRGRDPKTGAPGKWGNPYSHKEGTLAKFKVKTVEEAVECFRNYCLARPAMIEQIKRELKGKTLACWCKTKANPTALCHGDILVEIANDL